ncbi:MAG TPA: LuxR C-terminal-related transcriptional regulator [Polyangiaceae bacterium]|nr:LuxR C-terminal-related transcriptional regulator [Polyangiaceae bacterium]
MDAIAIVESAYALSGTESEWIHRLARTIRQNWEDPRWLSAWTFDVKTPAVARASAVLDLDEEEGRKNMRHLFAAMWDLDPVPFWGRMLVGTLRGAPDRYRRRGVDEVRVRAFEGVLEAALPRWGLEDELWINAPDPTGIGFCMIAPMSRRGPLSAPEKHRLGCIASHIATAFRVRRQFVSLDANETRDPLTAAEAILSPDGTLQHAERPAAHDRARVALRGAVRAVDRARGPLRRSEADEALATWRALVAGRWSLVDHFDTDGRRFIVAHRNDARVPDPRGLTLRERQILAYSRLGHSNKAIAYALGLSISTISTHLARARAKLKLPLVAALNLSDAGPAGAVTT